jgi:thiol:disulfide interchange protein
MRMIFALAIVLSLAWTAAAPAQEKLNHLSGESSPYFKRAISQPVDWYPWGAAAFGWAKELDRPILLDVGAVWCPWCDLMDRDTYTNAATADYINQHFVAVKVDFDASPKLVARLQRAQAILNLPAGLPSLHSLRRMASSTSARATCPLSTRETNSLFKKLPIKLLLATRRNPRSTKNHFNWR